MGQSPTGQYLEPYKTTFHMIASYSINILLQGNFL